MKSTSQQLIRGIDTHQLAHGSCRLTSPQARHQAGWANGNLIIRFIARLWVLQVNIYPGQRTFTAVGSGGDSFTQSMVTAVSSVVGKVAQEQVTQRSSSKGNYVSITVGPVWVTTADEVGGNIMNSRIP